MKTKNLLAVFALLAVVMIVGCKKDDMLEEIGLCPIIIQTNPEDGATNVPVDEIITITFNKEINPSTITDESIVIYGDSVVTGNLVYSGITATFTPTIPLTVNTTYTGKVKTTVKDVTGNALQEEYVWTFSTGQTLLPRVILTDPENNDTTVALNKVISASFNMEMEPSTINGTTFTLFQGANQISGAVSYLGVQAFFTPTSNLLPNTTYTATVTTGAQNLNGDGIDSNYVWTFRTGTTLIAPQVILTDPLNNESDVILNKNITATFNVAMDPLTITGTTFTLFQGATQIAGAVSYSGNMATFNPTNNLLPDTEYTATITTGAQNLAGTAIASNYVWRFTTLSLVAPQVILTDPTNNETGVLLNKNITATFNMAMNSTTINGTTFTLKLGATTIPGVVTYTGNIATFNPTNNLLPDTEYTATITTGAQNLAGTALVSNFVWTFRTLVLVAPQVISIDPANNETGVELNTDVTATFNMAMNPTTINGTTFSLRQGTTIIPGVVSYTGTIATFNPTNNLLPDTEYTATITTGAQNLAGTGIASNFVWTFRTLVVIPPQVISTNPLNNENGVALNTDVTATFNMAMNPATISGLTFTLKQGTTSISGSVSYNGNTATFNPTNNLSSNAVYTATITTGAQNLAGTGLASNYVWTFSTVAPLGPLTVNLDCAAGFAILAGSTIVNTGPTIIDGNLGLSAGTSVTGFPPGVVINGSIQINTTGANNAKLCLTTAFNDAAGRSLNVINVPSGQLGGLTLAPGLYRSGISSFEITGSDLTLDAQGDANAVWIFQMPSSTLTVGNAINVTLTNGASAKNIFWQVGSSATIGTTAQMKGNILADQSITLQTGAVLLGRALTRIAAVTLDSNSVTLP